MYTTTLILAAVGALNWGLVAIFDFNLVSAIFGTDSLFTNIVYILVAVSGAYALGDHLWRLGNVRSSHPDGRLATSPHRDPRV